MANRRRIADETNTHIKEMRKEIKEAQDECQEDINGIIQQMSEYPRRSEIYEILRDIRDQIRDKPR